jgi:oligoendopeptidase F
MKQTKKKSNNRQKQKQVSDKLHAESVRWDLSFLYSSINDPAIDTDVAIFKKRASLFKRTYEGNLATLLGPALSEYTELVTIESKIGLYIGLRRALDTSDTAVQAKSAEIGMTMSSIFGECLSFFMIELVGLSDETLSHLYALDPVVTRHRPWIRKQRLFKDHYLPLPVESALIKRSPFGPSSWADFHTENESDLRFSLGKKQLTLEEILHTITTSRNQKQRASLMHTLHSGLSGPFAKYSAQTLYMTAGGHAVETKERKHSHPMEQQNKSNLADDKTVEALHEAVRTRGASLARRYYQLKATLLGLKKLRWSDRNAPMTFSDMSTVPYDEALATVITAYKNFSPTLADIIRQFVIRKTIDAPAIPGKRGGAFNWSTTLPQNNVQSFTFLNYLGSTRDVMTLAHELGHGVHGILAGTAQGPLMSETPITYCETASVFGEMLTFHLLNQKAQKSSDKKAHLALLMSKLDDMMNTVVRQISFSNFERRLHGMNATYTAWEPVQKRSPKEISEIWMTTTKEMYGNDGDVFTYEDADLLWSYIEHFHRPFYVYGYAFGELLTQNLLSKSKILGRDFEPKYLNLLRAGGTKVITELVKPFELDPTHTSFWTDGLEAGIGALLLEAETLAKEIRH